MTVPSKTITERITVSVNFLDELPWGSVISSAFIDVFVDSGEDDDPDEVFWRILSLADGAVLVQVRLGLPGVIYRFLVRAFDGTDWYEKEFRLAVLPDNAIPPYLLTRSFTSKPYPLFFSDTLIYDATLVGGELDTLIQDGSAFDGLTLTAELVGGSLRDQIQQAHTLDMLYYTADLVGGTLRSQIQAARGVEGLMYSAALVGGVLDTVLIPARSDPEKLTYSASLVGGVLS